MAWKNGGGETTEIAVSPPGASMENFDWRVSMAHVASDGPFSLFPDIDRSLTLLEGEGIILRIAGRDDIHLTVKSPPCGFPGDLATEGLLVNGPILDLNVMTRRGAFKAEVTPIEERAGSIAPRGASVLVLLRGGSAEVNGAFCGDGDVVQMDPTDEPVVFRCEAATRLYCIRIA